MANSAHARRFHSLTRRQNALRWQNFDAQPRHVKEWFWEFPLNAWAPGPTALSQKAMDDADAKHLADLRNVWGPDHPAVIDAATRISTRRGQVVHLATIDDLADFF